MPSITIDTSTLLEALCVEASVPGQFQNSGGVAIDLQCLIFAGKVHFQIWIIIGAQQSSTFGRF